MGVDSPLPFHYHSPETATQDNMNRTNRNLINPSIFEPLSRTSLEDVENIIYALDPKLSKATLTQIIEALMQVDGVPSLELILAGTSTPISQWVAENFRACKDYSATIWCKALSRLVDFCYFNNLPTNVGALGFKPLECRQIVGAAEAVLGALSSLSLSGNADAPASSGSDGHLKIKPKSQRAKKLAKRQGRDHQLSPAAVQGFEALNETIPCSREGAEELAIKILGQQRDIFIACIDFLRDAANVSAIKTMCIYSPPEDPESGSIQSPSETPVARDERAFSADVFDLRVQPMKLALEFENAEGFGEWRVLISGAADKYLRETHKKNPTLFDIVIKKIKELSLGHFSRDNQKHLAGASTEIPIYEAKMTGDSRLVYHTDCIMDHVTEVATQVIRIFGIYTHTQLKHGKVWDSISRQLSKKGKEYRRRCIFRNSPVVPGDNVFSPASFPAQDDEAEEVVDPLDLPKEDLDELHSLLMLGKFVSLSQVRTSCLVTI
ncbi:hypothetical protein HGRIS_007378 [Hohenbuehelia grisea]|uniref:Uncharacterized protein n=1 Tax=Hohenbuehelia grisea TaxID=104357 RepID=A0ABR3J505_9AGAR